ncbi:MAG: hypothetical protein Kow0077_20990 [Anaerolineae bacterium]
MKAYKALLFALALVMVITLFPAPVAEARGPKGQTIAEIVVESAGPDRTGEFSTLLAAIEAADPAVLATLSGRGQFTVFAPTNAAFEAAFAELAALGITPADVLSNQELLTNILLYHVARGRRYADDVLDSSRIRTMQRGFLFQDGGVLTDALGREALIIVTDIEASNGVIHVIDAVVLPGLP